MLGFGRTRGHHQAGAVPATHARRALLSAPSQCLFPAAHDRCYCARRHGGWPAGRFRTAVAVDIRVASRRTGSPSGLCFSLAVAARSVYLPAPVRRACRLFVIMGPAWPGAGAFNSALRGLGLPARRLVRGRLLMETIIYRRTWSCNTISPEKYTLFGAGNAGFPGVPGPRLGELPAPLAPGPARAGMPCSPAIKSPGRARRGG